MTLFLYEGFGQELLMQYFALLFNEEHTTTIRLFSVLVGYYNDSCLIVVNYQCAVCVSATTGNG
ncbi:MAG TPA: hypothetical protein VF144_01670 [Chitinophagaceae bacterium]